MNKMIEFSRVVDLDDIGREGLQQEITATHQECADLAQRFGLLALEGFKAKLTLRKLEDGDAVTISGEFQAHVSQECIVTLDPVPVEISAAVEEKFVREDDTPPEAVVDADDEESYDELIEGNSIDVGEMLAQCLFLELDPYPRKEGIEFDPAENGVGADETSGPFAKLAELKRNNS